MITAAHCVRRRRGLKAVIGDHEPKKTSGDEQHINVCNTIVHPKYRGTGNDIAILKLCQPVNNSELVGKIDLPPTGFELKEREKLAVAGWGLTTEGGRISPILRVVWVQDIGLDLCKKAYPGQLENKICAGIWKYGGRDSCQGDSGGPLWHRNEDGADVLVGIVSSGRGCARPYYPGLYTKVSAFMGWVKEVMELES